MFKNAWCTCKVVICQKNLLLFCCSRCRRRCRCLRSLFCRREAGKRVKRYERQPEEGRPLSCDLLLSSAFCLFPSSTAHLLFFYALFYTQRRREADSFPVVFYYLWAAKDRSRKSITASGAKGRMDRASLDRASLVININRRLRDDWKVGMSQGERSSSRGDIWSWGPRLGVGEWWREGFFILFSLTSFYKLVFCASRCTEYQRKYSISEYQAKDHQLLESLFSAEFSLNFSRLLRVAFASFWGVCDLRRRLKFRLIRVLLSKPVSLSRWKTFIALDRRYLTVVTYVSYCYRLVLPSLVGEHYFGVLVASTWWSRSLDSHSDVCVKCGKYSIKLRNKNATKTIKFNELNQN